MTTATQDGRRLRLDIEGLDPMLVEPLSARRGLYLTEEFLAASMMERSQAKAEEIFIEALGPKNYTRIAGAYVVEYDEGKPIKVHGPDAEYQAAVSLAPPAPEEGARYALWIDPPTLPLLDGDPIRQEEGESLCLCAFYWQTVVGMEAVQAFLDDGGGTSGSLKALALLQTRLGLSPVANSRSKGMESLIRQGVSAGTNDTANSSGSVQLPAVKRPQDRLPRGLLKKARGRSE